MNKDIEKHIQRFVKKALIAEDAKDFDEFRQALGFFEVNNAWLLLTKIATGKAGMYEARDFINQAARESAFWAVDDSTMADRASQHWLDVANEVKL